MLDKLVCGIDLDVRRPVAAKHWISAKWLESLDIRISAPTCDGMIWRRKAPAACCGCDGDLLGAIVVGRASKEPFHVWSDRVGVRGLKAEAMFTNESDPQLTRSRTMALTWKVPSLGQRRHR